MEITQKDFFRMQEKNCSIFVGNFLNNGFRSITNFLINLNH